MALTNKRGDPGTVASALPVTSLTISPSESDAHCWSFEVLVSAGQSLGSQKTSLLYGCTSRISFKPCVDFFNGMRSQRSTRTVHVRLPPSFVSVFLLLRPQDLFRHHGSYHHRDDEEPHDDEQAHEYTSNDLDRFIVQSLADSESGAGEPRIWKHEAEPRHCEVKASVANARHMCSDRDNAEEECERPEPDADPVRHDDRDRARQLTNVHEIVGDHGW